MRIAQKGLCGCGCKRPLGKRVIAEHTLPVGLGNVLKPDALYRWGCAYLKTVNVDLPAITKADRQGQRKGQAARRAKRKSEGKPPLLQGRGFEGSRGFPKTLRKKLNGTVERIP